MIYDINMDVYVKAVYIRTGIVQYFNPLLLYLGIILGKTWGFQRD